MRNNRYTWGAWLWSAALALLLAPAARADLGGQAGPYAVRVQMVPQTPAIGDNQARVRVSDPSGKPVKGARVTVTTSMLDMDMGSETAQAPDDGTGTYTAPVSLSMGGNWQLTVAVDSPAGKGETNLKVATGVSTAASAGSSGGFPWHWIGAGAVLAALASLILVRRRGSAPTLGAAVTRRMDEVTARDAEMVRSAETQRGREVVDGGAGVARAPSSNRVFPALWLRQNIWGVAVIVLAILVSGFLVRRYKKPGQTTVLEAQAMDMSGMKAPVGAVPVQTETVQPGLFEAAVTYTGSVLSEADEDIYPRVVGKLNWMPFYPGDRIAPGQVVARLDNVELGAKVEQARADTTMKQYESAMARAGISQAESQRSEAEARAERARGALGDAQSQVIAAQGAVQQARSEAEATRNDLRDAQSQQISAQQERQQAQDAQEGARASLADAEAGVTSAQANLDYWKDEIKREAALLKSGAISQEEYDRENSQSRAAQAAVRQAQERVRSMQAALRASASKVKQSDANIGSAQARADKAQATISASQAKIDQAQAALQSAGARVAQAQADVREADAAVRTAGEAVRVAQQNAASGAAAVQGAAAGERTAAIVSGYTEIRSAGGGRVLQRLVAPGVLVSPGTPILKIARIDRVRLQANVAQTDLASIRVGAPVRVTSQKNPARVVLTRITSVFPASDPSSRTAVVEALTPNPGAFFLPGEFITLRIATEDQSQALAVASSAITDFEGKPAVWCVVNGKAQRVSVTTGKTDGQRTEILSGLKAGDVVITGGSTYLNSGDSVTPTQWGTDGPPDSALQHQLRLPGSGAGMPGGSTVQTPPAAPATAMGASGSGSPAAPTPSRGGVKDSRDSLPGRGH